MTNGLSTLLPLVPSDTPSAVVITGSKQGITNPPGNPAYNASKAAIKSLAESLSYEKRETQTDVHLLVPGWTFTGLTGGGNVKEKPEGAWRPEQVSDRVENDISSCLLPCFKSSFKSSFIIAIFIFDHHEDYARRN